MLFVCCRRKAYLRVEPSTATVQRHLFDVPKSCCLDTLHLISLVHQSPAARLCYLNSPFDVSMGPLKQSSKSRQVQSTQSSRCRANVPPSNLSPAKQCTLREVRIAYSNTCHLSSAKTRVAFCAFLPAAVQVLRQAQPPQAFSAVVGISGHAANTHKPQNGSTK